MRHWWHAVVSRLLLGVMLATFLSPTFAWHMNASHDDIEHAAHDHDHDHDDDGEQDAHGAIGHLLGHLPSILFHPPFLTASPARFPPRAAPQACLERAALEPPYRPPQLVLI